MVLRSAVNWRGAVARNEIIGVRSIFNCSEDDRKVLLWW